MPPEQRTANAQKGQKKRGRLLIWWQPRFEQQKQRGGSRVSRRLGTEEWDMQVKWLHDGAEQKGTEYSETKLSILLYQDGGKKLNSNPKKKRKSSWEQHCHPTNLVFPSPYLNTDELLPGITCALQKGDLKILWETDIDQRRHCIDQRERRGRDEEHGWITKRPREPVSGPTLRLSWAVFCIFFIPNFLQQNIYH